MSAIAIIPARGGSKRIPGKNRKMFHGHPIIYYSIKAAQESGLFSPGAIVVSTDDDWIGRYSEGCGARWYRRPAHLADDVTGTQEVARDVLDSELRAGEPWKYACCIYATAPLLTSDDLKRGYVDFMTSGMDYTLVDGWFYWGRADAFGRTPIDITTAVRCDVGDRWIDINTEDDWLRAEQMYAALFRQTGDSAVLVKAVREGAGLGIDAPDSRWRSGDLIAARVAAEKQRCEQDE